ncbi:MAG TPA: hypothetical protein P5055_13170, partial [Candidatus Paceibacterota bacterium]|nr:hypothetical protein [Candidatus Paceibacterota bacterium]
MKMIRLIVLASLLLAATSSRAARIAWVSFHAADDAPSAAAITAGFTRAPDAGYTALLAAQGHQVTRFVTVEGIYDYPDMVAALNTNDLVILSRSVPSGHYDAVEETAVWQSITVPILALGGYVNRANRLGFHTGDTIPDVNSALLRLRVNASAHPIFTGIALDADGTMVNPYAQIVTYTNASTGTTLVQRGISVITSPLIAGGTVLATVGTTGDAAFGGMVIGEFPAGLTSQRGDLLAAKRLVFLTGSREADGFTSEGAGMFDLQVDGQTLFLNAVSYLTTSQAPKCTVPLVGATNLVAGDAWTFDAGPIGEAPLTYQWYKNGQALPAGTDASLVFTSLALADAGEYQLVVANMAGRATSTVARLEFAVFPPSNITNALIAYWPLDTVVGTKTPDLVSGY